MAFGKRFTDFLNELDVLDDTIQAMFTSLPEDKPPFVVFHPAWGCFARQYDLNQVPVESEGKGPNPKELAESTFFFGKSGIFSSLNHPPSTLDLSTRPAAGLN